MPRMTEKDVTRARPQPGEEAQDHAAPRRQRGIQSIEVGMRVLQALTEQRRALPLKDLARLADMPPAKAHPYLVSFMATGLVKQHPLTGHYELGPAALQMGLVALQQLDPLTEASQEAAQLAARATGDGDEANPVAAHTRAIAATACTGYSPAAVSAESITASV